MPDASAASLLEAVLSLEAASMRLDAGPFQLEVGKFSFDGLALQFETGDGKLRLASLAARKADLSGVKVQGPIVAKPPHASPGTPAEAWSLAPLATANGKIRAEIVDAALVFDADVTIPIKFGQIDFDDVTVEHVGPDSRMGVSKLGLYVDAPNGRSYIFQFPSAPLAGVEFERRGALLGPWISDRGKLKLQEFGESMLAQPRSGAGAGMTEQSRHLLERTSLGGELQLGEGRFAVPGM